MLYRLEDVLGHGPTGPVRRGVPDRIGARAVAVRTVCLDDRGVSRLRRHAETLALVGHRGLGLIEDVTRIDDERVLVATTLGATTVADRLADGRTYTVEEVLEILGSTASALAAAHRAALAHGAVHAGNVVWSATEPGRVLLVDLGLSDVLADRATTAHAWRRDRSEFVSLARALVADLSPAGSRLAALRDLVVDGGEQIVDAADGLETVARECDRIRRRPHAPVTAAVTRTRGRPSPAPSRPHRRRRAPVLPLPHVLAAAAVVVAGVIVGLGMMRHRGELPEPHVAEPVVCDSTDAAPDGEYLDGLVDRDGDGCADAVTWSSGDAVLVIADGATSQRFRVGRPGDQALLGDWDCDGERTVGLYRPSTGETFHFSTWADTGAALEATPGPVIDANAAARVVDEDGCERVATS